jgi:hypothetical protein
MDSEVITSTPNETEIILFQLLKNINWKKFNRLCLCLGNELNDHQWRFLKAVFLERAVAAYSNNQLTYVGQEGCDFTISSLNNIKLEMKYVADCLFTCKSLILRKNTKQITLLNSKGTNKHSKLPDHYSDYLLIVEMNGAAFISKEKLEQYVVVNGDSLSAVIPTCELHIIVTPNDMDFDTEKRNLFIKEKIVHIIDEIISTTNN